MLPTSRSIAAALVAALALGAPAAATATSAPDRAPGAAARADAPEAGTLDELMRVTRLGEQSRDAAASMARTLVEGARESDRPAPPGTAVAVRRAAELAFSPDRVEGLVAARLAGELSAEDARRVAERAAAPLWQRALDGEDAHDLDEDPEGFARFASSFGAGPEDAERIAATAALLEAAGGAELMGAIAIDTRKAMVHGAALADPSAGPARTEAALAAIEARRGAIVERMGRLMPVVLAWSYQGLSTKELRALVVEARRPEWRRFNAVAAEAVRDAMVLGSLEFADRAARAAQTLSKTSRI